MIELGKGILVFSMIHAYVFSILLISYKKSSTSFLGLYLFTCAINYFFYLNTIYFHVNSLNFLLYYFTPAVSLTSMPFVYLYVKKMTTEAFKITKRKVFIHFSLSFVFFLITAYFILRLNQSDKELLFSGSTDINHAYGLFLSYLIVSILVMIQLFVYSFLMIKSMYNHENNVEQYYSNKSNKTLVWLKVFVFFYVIYYLFEFVIFIFSGISLSDNVYYSIVSLHIFFVGYMGVKQREIYTNESIEHHVSNSDFEKSEDGTKKLSVISPELRDQIVISINRLMKDEKIYLQEDLSLYDLAKILDINKNYLSHIINDSLKTNFYNLINTYRIEDAKKMLLNPEFDNLSIEGIAQSVGFKTRSVFYPVFKKHVGKTPTEFKKDNQFK